MANLKFSGPMLTRLASFWALNRIAITTYARHALGKRMEPSWDAHREIGIRFVRHQFTKAMGQTDMSKGRMIFDSLLTETDDLYPVDISKSTSPHGSWYHPRNCKTDVVLLYLHGGGYTFNGPISERFASMLAHHSQASVFMPYYRPTPEHQHPAQAEDAIAAWHYVASKTPPERIVVIGDSAGGHMALMLLQSLKSAELPQPALCIGLCPWTDIGARGKSLHENDQYDLVQGWMALQFGKWLDPEDAYGREHLSPISYDYSQLAPLYLQAGGREVLRDMIIDFAQVQATNGADIMLDLWDDMPHDFQAYDSYTSSSQEALERITQVIKAQTSCESGIDALPTRTIVAEGIFTTNF